MSFRVELEPNASGAKGHQIWNPNSNWAIFSLGKTADLEAEDLAQALSYARWRAKEVEAVPDKL